MIKAHIKQRLQLFTIQPFKCFVLSGIFATFGNGLVYVTLSWMLLEQSDSLAAQALLMTCFWLPSILSGPLAGILADRYNRKILTILSNSTRGFLILCTAILGYQGHPANLYLVATGLGIFFSLYGPAATVLIREIVPEKNLLHANASMDVIYEFGSVFGMAASGLLITLCSIHTTLITGGICFLLSALWGCLMHYIPHDHKRTSDAPREKFRNDFFESMDYLKKTPLLLQGYCVQMLIMVILMTLPAMLAPFVKQVLQGNVSEFGYLEAFFSCGVVAGGLISPFLVEVLGFRKILFSHLSLLTLALFLFSMTTALTPGYLLYTLIGITISSWALILTKTQELTDIKFQGRLYSAFNGVGGILTLTVFLSLMTLDASSPAATGYWLETILAAAALIIFSTMKAAEKERLVQNTQPPGTSS